MSQVWYYVENGESQGPVSQEDFDRLSVNGTIGPDTLVWQDGMGDWVAAGTLASGSPAPVAPAFGESAAPQSTARADASTFLGALKDGFSRYVDFGTRSNRPQFWFWTLWTIIIGLVTGAIDGIMGAGEFGAMGLIANLVTFLPSIAVAIRRLHDIGRSGWWYLMIFLPIIGWIVLLVFFCTRSDEQSNRWGPVPR